MQSILIITRHTPLPWEDGAGAYLHDQARFLARRGFRVDVLWLKPHDHLRWKIIWRLPRMFSPSVHLHLPGGLCSGRSYFFPGIVWLPFKARTLNRIRRVLRAVGINPRRRRCEPAAAAADQPAWNAPPTPEELAMVRRFVARHRPAVAIASYAWMCPLFDLPELRGARFCCLTHDVCWQRSLLTAQQHAGGSGEPQISRADESRWLRRAGLIIAISETDALELRAMAPAAVVVVAPKAMEARTPVPETDSQRLLFVGSDNAFNIEGLEWFLRQVWPRVRRRQPDATLDVCGSIDRSVKLRPAGVLFHGMVDSLDACYRQAAIVVVPLQRATGMNIKLVEAAAFGRVMITTATTLAGAPLLRDAVLVADSPRAFADTVLRLLGDPAARAAMAARALTAVQAQLQPDACYGPLAARLAERGTPAATTQPSPGRGGVGSVGKSRLGCSR
jgi:glycosyltransferase involved in cell wall biosynthesis